MELFSTLNVQHGGGRHQGRRIGLAVACWLCLLLCSFYQQPALAKVKAKAKAKTSQHHQSHKAILQAMTFSPLPGEDIQIKLHFSKPIGRGFRSFATHKPATLVFDLLKVQSGLQRSRYSLHRGNVDKVEVLQTNGRARLIVHLYEFSQYETIVDGNDMLITVHNGEGRHVNHELGKFAAGAVASTSLKSVDFRRNSEGGGQVVFELLNRHINVDVHVQAGKILLSFADLRTPNHLQRRFDVTDFATPVDSIDVMQHGHMTIAEINTHGYYEHTAYQVNNKFIVDIVQIKGTDMEVKERKQYTGKRLSLVFQDISVRRVLQVIADFTGLNIVTSDSVKGSLTLRLRSVPWDEALDIILRTQGLAKREIGNIFLIAPLEEITEQERRDLESKLQVEQLEPLMSELLQVNYAQAAELADLLKNPDHSLLSPRGNVSVEERTNTLWIQDTFSKLKEVRSLIKKLDRPVKQVLIEARIVRVNSDFERNLGIRFGITKADHKSGTFNAANQLAQGVDPALIDPPTDRLNMDLPAMKILEVRPASIGVALANLGKDHLLDLELSALEKEGGGEIISSPRLITSNKQPAYIEEGTEIPYQEATSSGATSTEFKKAVLSLRVTPQITPDGRINMAIRVNQDTVSSEILGAVPAIDTRKIETQVLVNNGDTIVLGGIFQQTKTKQIFRVPLLGDLPVLGIFFRQTKTVNQRSELLIFLTPKIIQDSDNHL